MRIGLAITMAIDVLDRWPDLLAHYTESGVTPGALVLKSHDLWSTISPYFFLHEPLYLKLVFSCHLLAALCLLVGYRTKLFSFLCWVLIVFITGRNPDFEHGLDIILKNFLFLGIFLPWGKMFSVDSFGEHGRERLEKKHVFSPATVAVLLQILTIYTTVAIAKSFGEYWQNGEAVYYVLKQQSNLFSYLIDDYQFLVPYLTYGTIIAQFSILLILIPWKSFVFRLVPFFSLITLHAGILLTMNLRAFALAPMAVLLVFFPFWIFDKKNIEVKGLGLRGLLWVPAVFSLLLLANNLGDWRALSRGEYYSGWSSKVFKRLQLMQRWNMFAGVKPEVEWFVIKLIGKNGEEYDYLRKGPYVDDSRFIDYQKSSHVRWRIFYMNLPFSDFYQEPFARFLCKEVSQIQPVRAEIYRLTQRIKLHEASGEVVKRQVFSKDCQNSVGQ